MMNDRNSIGKEVLLVRQLHDQNVVYFAKKTSKYIQKTNSENQYTVQLKFVEIEVYEKLLQAGMLGNLTWQGFRMKKKYGFNTEFTEFFFLKFSCALFEDLSLFHFSLPLPSF